MRDARPARPGACGYGLGEPGGLFFVQGGRVTDDQPPGRAQRHTARLEGGDTGTGIADRRDDSQIETASETNALPPVGERERRARHIGHVSVRAWACRILEWWRCCLQGTLLPDQARRKDDDGGGEGILE